MTDIYYHSGNGSSESFFVFILSKWEENGTNTAPSGTPGQVTVLTLPAFPFNFRTSASPYLTTLKIPFIIIFSQ